MITINTLTEQEIDNIPIRNIDLGVRVKNILINENINTLEDLKNLVLEKGFSEVAIFPNCGTVSQNKIKRLLKHSYPNINFDEYVDNSKYTFEEDKG